MGRTFSPLLSIYTPCTCACPMHTFKPKKDTKDNWQKMITEQRPFKYTLILSTLTDGDTKISTVVKIINSNIVSNPVINEA